ncbi:SHOCT domain-containing protein [Paenarthrobacter nicotinovorans]|jgi:putative membrane protein|uniref:SHOCT domain-containing protein n=2 Tax=Paenarthrobacter nicotinovorans TaxID=29320 RepID=UPI002782FB25|nr:SHOCT domain-containing protein [Paenarthrobacter nicotinovorans]MDP9933894.1 putative membrane protein [Paenarthrobacter nicotinovorans]
MMWGYGMGNGWMVIWTIAGLLGLALLILITVRLFNNGASNAGNRQDQKFAPPVSGRSTARLILDERFARGELTAEAYRENLRILGDGN